MSQCNSGNEVNTNFLCGQENVWKTWGLRADWWFTRTIAQTQSTTLKRNNLRRPKSVRPPCTTTGTATNNIINNLRSRTDLPCQTHAGYLSRCPALVQDTYRHARYPGTGNMHAHIYRWILTLVFCAVAPLFVPEFWVKCNTPNLTSSIYLFPQMINYWEWYRSPRSKQWGKKRCMITYDGLSSPCHVTSSWNFAICDWLHSMWPDSRKYSLQ